MPKDKYSALWLSHSSVYDYIRCPRAYFLKNVYRSPDTGHKIKVISPPLSLGQAVHEVLDSISSLPVRDRFKESLISKFHQYWKNLKGKRGGFITEESEEKYRKRGEKMLNNIMKDPGPLAQLAIKIKDDLPHFWLSEEKNIILCGKIDWLEYLEDTDAVHIIDFKTSSYYEENDSLQLPIYHLLVSRTQNRPVSKISYWYLEKESGLVEKEIPDINETKQILLKIADEISLSRKLSHFKCPTGETGCFLCVPYEKIIKGEAEYIGVTAYRDDLYLIERKATDRDEASIIL